VLPDANYRDDAWLTTAAVRGTHAPEAIALSNVTTGTITFPQTGAWSGLEKTEEGECHENKQILG
jgi:hypothetical protein